jgi:hypothetical protein
LAGENDSKTGSNVVLAPKDADFIFYYMETYYELFRQKLKLNAFAAMSSILILPAAQIRFYQFA